MALKQIRDTENYEKRALNLVKEIEERLDPKHQKYIKTHIDRLSEFLAVLEQFGIEQADDVVRGIVRLNRKKLVDLLETTNRTVQILNDLKAKFGDDLGNVLAKHPQLLWYRVPIEQIITSREERIQNKIKILKTEIGIEVKNPNDSVLNLSIETAVARSKELMKLGLDPTEYKSRLVYSPEALDWLKDLAVRLFPDSPNPVQTIREKFSSSYPDKLILNRRKAEEKLKILIEKKGEERTYEYLRDYPNYLTANIPDPDEYAKNIDSRKNREEIKIRKQKELEQRREARERERQTKREKKFQLLREILGRDPPNYLMKFGMDQIKARAEFLKENGINITPSKIYNIREKDLNKNTTCCTS